MSASYDKTDGFNRRAFLKGSGAVAAAASLHQQASEVSAADSKEVVSGSKKITLNVNGEDVSVEVEPRTTLLEALRYQLDLTGAKPVSMDGSSGASTVLINGKPKMASTTLAIACRRKEITTVEGLDSSEMEIVKDCFVKNNAMQCGFCSSGMLMTAYEMIKSKRKYSREEIREMISGNYCRCTGYQAIVDAVEDSLNKINVGM